MIENDPVNSWDQTWGRYLQMQKQFWTTFFAFVGTPILILLFAKLALLPFVLLLIPVQLFLTAQLLVRLHSLATFPCPSCQKTFFKAWYARYRWFIGSCLHCGLPKYTNPNDSTEAS